DRDQPQAERAALGATTAAPGAHGPTLPQAARGQGRRPAGSTPGVGAVNAVSQVTAVFSLVSSSPVTPLPVPCCTSWPASSMIRLVDRAVPGAAGCPAIVRASAA